MESWSIEAAFRNSFCVLFNPQEHVIALNNKIVESGGKPLLGKDQCNINRLEWKVEEFLNAVLHKKGMYTYMFQMSYV